tara:strand:+ start:703 stop:855 length:153 start_codon:yes stop_codon:yes gene_type:complete
LVKEIALKPFVITKAIGVSSKKLIIKKKNNLNKLTLIKLYKKHSPVITKP